MEKLSRLSKTITSKYGDKIDLKKNPEILMDIITELRISEEYGDIKGPTTNPGPFEVEWMDSWAANWFLNRKIKEPRPAQSDQFSTAIQQLTDLKFRQRIEEIRQFVIDQGGILAEPPDAGPPEPGVPPGGPSPSSIFTNEPPDAGPPEPGVPPAPDPPSPPDGGPPEPGVPPGPGPDGGIMHRNPWILYWFVSLNTPFILDMIDAHFTRRINDLQQNMNV